ncbi:MAG: hypothetical protein AUJ31_02335 [Parcubacteria group bacterium CG1_02_39_15]|uniref:Cell division protein FtsL n=2 Tax=Candidatus Nealsoniibacteriota TaxID=1817911 RepID=A0A2G9YT72_9BACT|nr:MAG: hypothetical protein AUJ31_02335 [Parcubacteria group bacterium CG1_02_39_15]PIP22427.1 MAG: hypothetical protein COX38_00640 [Candidatus Nealsonbacteria bacterium CG23_combo_of_CG06-09_8_20_14_all_39_25]PIZ88256.1 MAG: hypothetical protein COX91_01160 [Candidatus Nealsonbacteria bacterium CG_4_10_14_0_2_um_filter_39_15]
MTKNTFPLSLNLKLFWTLAFAAAVFLVIFYIFQINIFTRDFYLNQQSKQNLEALTQENEALKIDFSKAGSLANINNYLQSQSFEKVKQVKYIQIFKPVAANPGLVQ